LLGAGAVGAGELYGVDLPAGGAQLGVDLGAGIGFVLVQSLLGGGGLDFQERHGGNRWGAGGNFFGQALPGGGFLGSLQGFECGLGALSIQQCLL